MIDGIYDIYLDTIIGKKSGIAKFKNNNGEVTCILNFDGKDFITLNGKYEEEYICKFEGSAETIVGKVDYKVECKVIDEVLTANISTNKGNLSVTGKKSK